MCGPDSGGLDMEMPLAPVPVAPPMAAQSGFPSNQQQVMARMAAAAATGPGVGGMPPAR